MIDWKDPSTWVPAFSRWVSPYLNDRGIRHLNALGPKRLHWDDPDWRTRIAQQAFRIDVEEVGTRLGSALKPAFVETHHGCLTADAGTYLRLGLLRNDPDRLEEEVRRMVREEDAFARFRPDIEARIARNPHRNGDAGRLYLALDDRALVEKAGHYLIYGSEWVVGVLGACEELRGRGTPTLVKVRLPLSAASEYDRRELAEALLQEWTRIKVNRPNDVPVTTLDFILRADVPPAWVTGHSHPERVRDTLLHLGFRHYPDAACRECRQEPRPPD
ncbi:hypothetical protein CHU95_03260 [Niveispirillum lacus]|uniref:Uncharacterized protein n=1 Tax=Niveispirillum lacus TaxID=1981099 RepID=A0A255Z5J2_9PROT|nr:hypothetical protein [Niveispirillum lacus]OYQ36803.1 hypothetical protein CHU95_03260 [Niveispirillum lacus]